MTKISPSKDLAGGQVVANPRTGELIDLAGATDDELTGLIVDIREHKAEVLAPIDEAYRAACDQAQERMDLRCKWTISTASGELRGESPNRVDYDPRRLAVVLDRLAKSGLIDQVAAEQALPQKPTVSKAGVNALLKRGDGIATAIEECRVPIERARRITVKK